MSNIEDKILDNMKFRELVRDNVLTQPWLLNYELGDARVPIDDKESQSSYTGKGTVYSRYWKTGKNEWTVVPSIMENDKGKLEYYEDDDEPFKRGYGIKFDNKDEADRFSNWLHELHQMSGEGDGQSYEL